jgi:hypothetical protein
MWRSVHKMMHNTLNVKTAVAYIPYQDLENKDMMMAFLNQPEDFLKHVRRYTTSLTTQMVFGYRTTSNRDPRLLEFFEVGRLSRYLFRILIGLQNFEEWGNLVTAGTAQLMDLYPILRNLPTFLNQEYRDAKRLSDKECALYMMNWMTTKRKIIDGTCHVSFSLPAFEH